MNIQEFQDKLKEIQTLAMQNGKQVQAELVENFFGKEGMDRDKLQKVYDFLEIQGITVHGYEKEKMQAGNQEERHQEEGTETAVQQIPLTPQLFQELRQGADVKEQILKSYQKELVQTAKELHSGEIFFGDLLQEGNMGLLMALERAAEQEEIHTWLVNEIRSTIRLFLEEQNQQKKEDDILVEKVRNLEARVKELTEDEDVKYSVEELAVFLDMDVEEMESVLRLTGDDK